MTRIEGRRDRLAEEAAESAKNRQAEQPAESADMKRAPGRYDVRPAVAGDVVIQVLDDETLKRGNQIFGGKVFSESMGIRLIAVPRTDDPSSSK